MSKMCSLALSIFALIFLKVQVIVKRSYSYAVNSSYVIRFPAQAAIISFIRAIV